MTIDKGDFDSEFYKRFSVEPSILENLDNPEDELPEIQLGHSKNSKKHGLIAISLILFIVLLIFLFIYIFDREKDAEHNLAKSSLPEQIQKEIPLDIAISEQSELENRFLQSVILAKSGNDILIIGKQDSKLEVFTNNNHEFIIRLKN